MIFLCSMTKSPLSLSRLFSSYFLRYRRSSAQNYRQRRYPSFFTRANFWIMSAYSERHCTGGQGTLSEAKMKRRESTTDDVSPLHRDPRTLSSSSSSSFSHPSIRPSSLPFPSTHSALCSPTFLTRDDDTRLFTPHIQLHPIVSSFSLSRTNSSSRRTSLSLSLFRSLSLSFDPRVWKRARTQNASTRRCANTRSFSEWHASLDARRENVPESGVVAKR